SRMRIPPRWGSVEPPSTAGPGDKVTYGAARVIGAERVPPRLPGCKVRAKAGGHRPLSRNRPATVRPPLACSPPPLHHKLIGITEARPRCALRVSTRHGTQLFRGLRQPTSPRPSPLTGCMDGPIWKLTHGPVFGRKNARRPILLRPQPSNEQRSSPRNPSSLLGTEAATSEGVCTPDQRNPPGPVQSQAPRSSSQAGEPTRIRFGRAGVREETRLFRPTSPPSVCCSTRLNRAPRISFSAAEACNPPEPSLC